MKALHSSSALAVNFFDFWVGKDATLLMQGLGICLNSPSIAFEVQCPTGLKGTPPHLDVGIRGSEDRFVGVESKFSEWLAPKSKNKVAFRAEYFPKSCGIWEVKGLPQSQKLAEAINTHEVFFRHLDAPQLLKHSLGMASQEGSRFSLYYIYYDCVGLEAESHREEIDRFADMVGDELRFKTKSYQEVFSNMLENGAIDQHYLTYLQSRYFPD